MGPYHFFLRRTHILFKFSAGIAVYNVAVFPRGRVQGFRGKGLEFKESGACFSFAFRLSGLASRLVLQRLALVEGAGVYASSGFPPGMG